MRRLERTAEKHDVRGIRRARRDDARGAMIRDQPERPRQLEHRHADPFSGHRSYYLEPGLLELVFPEAEVLAPIRALAGFQFADDLERRVQVAGIDAGLDEIVADGDAMDFHSKVWSGECQDL